jgi:uncharacterized protein (TIGR03437 family)
LPSEEKLCTSLRRVRITPGAMTSVKTLLLFLLVLSAGFAQTQTLTYSYSGPPAPIGYGDNVAYVLVQVPSALRITSVTTQIQVDYPQVGDLNVYLFSASGTRTILLQRNCGTLTNIDTTFADSASVKFSSFCPVEAGRGPFQGNQPLANFTNESSLGIWQLAVQNSGSASRTGVVRTFSLTITGTVQTQPVFRPETVVGAASGRYGAVAPGQLLSIYGSGLGPAAPVAAPPGDFPTTLGGTTVIMDGIRVAIYFSSADLVQIQVPYAEIPGTYALTQVQYGNQASSIIGLPVRTALPGIYTSGEDPTFAKALNQDGTLNSISNPAAKGSIVTLYLNGLGLTSPAISSGATTPTSPLLPAFYPVLAFVGGVPATVAFAGLAPSTVGVYQVNLQIPTTVSSGTQDLLVLAVNGVTSQSGVSIAVQ